jgi:crotonobetainyl-CoA:carnitine CoA-transferase CaiB-like acyl-CoA transferase
MAKRPLENLTVLDLTHMLSGPFATMVLADLGAEAIKIEPPGRGEATRQLLADDPAHSRESHGAYFLTLNRGKKSVAIDLKRPEGRELFYRLVKSADVVVDNFSPGVTTRLGLDHASLSAANPAIITCSISGFGANGPNADRTAFDLVAQAMGGGMSITGEATGRALRAGIPIGDLAAGLFAAVGILAALQARAATGRGQAVDISMLDCQVSLLNYMATMFLMSGEQPARLGNAHFAHVPYDTFPTATLDLVVCILTDAQWQRFATMIGMGDENREEFATRFGRLVGRERLLPLIEARLALQSCEHWLGELGAAGVPCAPVNDFAHALADPQIVHRGMVVDVTLPGGSVVSMPGNPVKLSDAGKAVYPAPPVVGEHTRGLLAARCGMGEAELSGLAAAGIIQLAG